MPFSGTFQAQNNNGEVLPTLNNVLDNVTWNSQARSYYYPVYYLGGMNSILHEPVSRSNPKLYMVRASNGTGVSGISYSGSPLFKLNNTTILSGLGQLHIGGGTGTHPRDASYSETGDKVFITINLNNYSAILARNLQTPWSVLGNGSVGDVWTFASSPINGLIYQALNALTVFNDVNASNAQTAIVSYSNILYKIRLPAGGGSQPTVQSHDVNSDFTGRISGINMLYNGLRMLVVDNVGIIVEYSFQSNGYSNLNRRYDLDWLQKVKTIDFWDITGLTRPSNLSIECMWCDRDDPHTSGIWTNRDGYIYQLDVNGTKYS